MNSNHRALALMCQRRGRPGNDFFAEAQANRGFSLKKFCDFFSFEGQNTLKDEHERLSGRLDSWETRDGIRAVTRDEQGYPAMLRHIPDPPSVLFYQGDLLRFSSFAAMAVVGSRGANSEGCQIAFDFGLAFAASGLNVVSGLALGIDSSAHRGALSAGHGVTTAVMGGGLLNIYPAQNRRLAEEILSAGGALLSQFEPDQSPRPHQFLDRNRIVSGLSKGVVIVQAALRSGALSTANHALEQGREVFAVPGSICSPLHAGCHKLLSDGAQLAQSPLEVMRSVGVEPAVSSGSRSEPVGTKSKRVLNLIASEQPISVPELFARSIGTELEGILLNLELAGLILREPGELLRITQKGVSELD